MLTSSALVPLMTAGLAFFYGGMVCNDAGHGLIGNQAQDAGPRTVDVAFQAMFAIITVALVSGAVAGRLRFGPWLVFAAVWATMATGVNGLFYRFSRGVGRPLMGPLRSPRARCRPRPVRKGEWS
jgi:ammonia channel protein AmtB